MTEATETIVCPGTPTEAIDYQHYAAAEIHYESPMARALSMLKNQWDLQELIDILDMPMLPPPLVRSVGLSKYNAYNEAGLILHREYRCDYNYNLVRKEYTGKKPNSAGANTSNRTSNKTPNQTSRQKKHATTQRDALLTLLSLNTGNRPPSPAHRTSTSDDGKQTHRT